MSFYIITFLQRDACTSQVYASAVIYSPIKIIVTIYFSKNHTNTFNIREFHLKYDRNQHFKMCKIWLLNFLSVL